MDIKGIKMNGEILKEFSAGGGACYRHVIEFENETLIFYSELESKLENMAYVDPFADYGGKKYGLLIPTNAPCSISKIYFRKSELIDVFLLHYSFYNTKTESYEDVCPEEKNLNVVDEVTQVPFPFM